MAEDHEGVSTYLLAASLVATVLLFTLRLSGGAKMATVGASLACAGYLLVRFFVESSPSVDDRGPAWLGWVLTPFAVTLLLAIGRGEGSSAGLSTIGLVVTGGVLVAGARRAIRAANLAALFLVSASLLIALLDARYVVSGARDFMPILYSGRAFGLLQQPNGLGQMSAVLFMLAWNRRSRLSFLVSVIGLLAAASQTALLAVLVASCCVLSVRQFQVISTRYRPAFVWLGTACILVFLWLVMASVVTLPTLAVSRDDLTLTNRTMIWQQLSAGGVPPLGLGGNGLSARLAASTQVGSAHDMWLQAWLLDGIPGVVALVIAVLMLAGMASRGMDPSLALGGLALFLIEGLTESSPAHPIFFPFFVALIAFATRMTPLSAANRGPHEGVSRRLPVAPS